MAAFPKRNEIDEKYKWDLTAIYPSEASFEEDFQRAEQMVSSFPCHEAAMCSGSSELYSALSDWQAISAVIGKLWQYANLGFCVDMQNNEAQARTARVRTLSNKASTASWFLVPKLIKLDAELIKDWLSENEKLASFSRVIEKIVRMKPYTLSDEGERIMSEMEERDGAPGEIRSIFSNSDLRFGVIKDERGERVELTEANYVKMLMSGDRALRRRAFKTLYKTYSAFGNTFATMYRTHVKEECTLSAVRGFENSITASTFADEITPQIYNNLINTVRRGLPVLYDYYELKREALGVQRLHMYDLYTPLVSENVQSFSYEEAVGEVLDFAKIFGEEYYEALRSGLLERGWVDVYPSRGKRSGAFSAGTSETEPYILMNFNGTYNDVSTLAHEAGHSMHSWFSSKYNEGQNSRYTIFVAEVASTVNELLLAHKRLRESENDDEKLSILGELIETYKSTLYRQTMFAEFERDMHSKSERGEPLTRDVLCNSYYGLIRKYFGGGVVKDKEIAYEWMRIPHFYSSFYVYKYATCISAASAIVKRIESEGEGYIKKYIEFLKCGNSRSPLDSLLVAEIDMSDPSVVLDAIEDFKSCIGKFRELYKQKQ